MAYVLVDFDTHMGRDFDRLRPIGVWLTLAGGGVALRYLEAVEEGEDPGYENYMTTFRQLELPLLEWRAGVSNPDFASYLEYVSGTTYLGHSFRTFGVVPDEMTIEEAFEMFVVRAEALPVSEVPEVPVGS